MKHITGAEALELVEAATPGPWHASDHLEADADWGVCDGNGSTLLGTWGEDPEDGANAALCAAAPDLAESLAAVEAERDALSRALFLSDAARDNEESAYLALLAERDALRAAARELLGAYGDFSVEYPPTIDEAARFHAALAALREAAK